jgi:hypothetical protein
MINKLCCSEGETIPEAWERFQEYVSDCPHGMEE